RRDGGGCCTFPARAGYLWCHAPRPSLTRLVRTTRFARALLGAAALLMLAAPLARAQMGAGDGFLFRVPTVRLGVSAGFAQPRGRSDVFDFLTDELTLDRRDFDSAAFTLSAAYRVAPRIEVGLGTTFASRSAGSESRDFVGEDDLPVLQTTTLDRLGLMATVRASLAAPGRAVGRYAWIPNRVVPFVGGGAGPVWYRLRQTGEFVDKQTLDIFEDQFESTGWSLGATGFGGADVSLSPRFGVSVEGRYLWARGPMNGDFGTFNKIDLSGYDASIGLFVRF
ncbi:MAG TPA: hypothetical protein VFV33_22050, partial [Gemmatimonadaceae bacterium]|nr:hypothetical protein [Gemmatimonadaceae bacterium]